jgi:hypothetical protein
MMRAIALSLALITASPAFAGNAQECRDNANEYASLINGPLLTAAQDYASCVRFSRGMRTCTSEFDTLERRQKEFARLVLLNMTSDCP